MTAQEQVAKLEALLARVNSRRGAPRSAPDEDRTSEPARAASAAPVAPPALEARTPAPPSFEASPASIRSVPPSADVEVEVEEGVAEVDLAGIDEDAGGAVLSDSVADLDTVAGPSDDADQPASSRRPIQLQPPLAEQAFGDAVDAKAPHPVPPESGRQMAIPPVSDFESDLSGVRSVPAAAAPTPATPTPATPAPPPLRPEVTTAALDTGSPAAFHGAVPAFKPETFGELLRATLGL